MVGLILFTVTTKYRPIVFWDYVEYYTPTLITIEVWQKKLLIRFLQITSLTGLHQTMGVVPPSRVRVRTTDNPRFIAISFQRISKSWLCHYRERHHFVRRFRSPHTVHVQLPPMIIDLLYFNWRPSSVSYCLDCNLLFFSAHFSRVFDRSAILSPSLRDG